MRLRPPSPPQRRPRLLVEELDPRILYSADAAALLGLAGGPGGAEVREVSRVPMAAVPPASNSAQVQAAREIVFIDSRVPDALALADQLMQQRGPGAMFDIVMLDANADGLEQINRALAAEHGLAAVHLISHGSEGSIQLGSSVLDAATLARDGDAVARWGEALGADGDLLLYGCNVAGGAAGQLFLHDLAALTGADVAASTGLTGSAAIGGDWTLEFATGTLHTQLTPARFDALQWQGVLATFFVVNTNDTGLGSLRQAIQDANANGIGLDVINFAIGGTGIHTINLGSALLVQGAVTIDATTDDSFAFNGNRPAIVLNGQNAVSDGFQLVTNSSGSTIRGFVIQNFTQDGIDIASSSGNTIVGNWIGLNAAGTAAAGNQQGINLWNASNNTIGGSSAADRNVISGSSGTGLFVGTDSGSGTGNQIRGNYIGTNAAGTAAVGNGNFGILLLTPGNTVGGTGADEGNVISGTLTWDGLALGSGASNTLVAGNLIGLNAAGTAALGNAGGGVVVNSANNTIGGTTANARNVISGNTGNGLELDGIGATGNVVIGNYIGTNAAGTGDIDGTVQVGGNNGIAIVNGASNNRIGTNADGSNDAQERNVISGNNWVGVDIVGAGTSGNVVQGNYIGTDASGLVALRNGLSGVSFWGGASGNQLGSGLAGAGNVLSGNTYGVLIGLGATNNEVQGNLIGLGADGSTSLGNAINGVWLHNGGSAALVTGNLIGTDADGSNDAAERNIISANQNGLLLENAEVTGNTIAGNYIGTDATGLLLRGNLAYGVVISNGAHGNTVGGSLAAQRNVVAGSVADGISIDGEASDGNTVRGNWIGANAAGTGTLGNSNGGVRVSGGADNTVIGGTGPTEGNWIVGNTGTGIALVGASSGTVIQGNRIGTDAAGTANMGQGQEGIWISGGATGTLVGGTTAQAANVIAFNGQAGMFDDGISVQDAGSTGNVFLGNSIYNNVGLGIDLGLDGADPIDANDADIGPNNLLNTIVLSGAAITPGLLRVSGTYTGAPDTWYRVEVFSTPGPEASGTGEGRTFLGSANMPVGPSGTITGSYDFGVTVADGTYLSATVTRTDSGYSTFYETSEFSNQAVAQAVGITVTPVGALATTEAGATAQFSVVLDSQPTADVTIALSTSDATEGTLSSNSLTFTTANWNVAQVVTVTGVDDTLDDGDTAYTLITAAATSADVNYNGLNAADLSATNSDDDTVNTVFVTTTADTADGDTSSLDALLVNQGADGKISLREALIASENTANGSGGADRIHFAISGTGEHVINVTGSALPTIDQAVLIDGSSDDSFAANGNRPAIVLDGDNIAGNGLTLSATADGSTIRGLVIRDFGNDGLSIQGGSDNHTISGNYLGALTSGGTSAGAGEANAGSGLGLEGAGSVVTGNVISGNASRGIHVVGGTGNTITANLIGVAADGSTALGNDTFSGIYLSGGAANNRIGGTGIGEGNTIAYNGSPGVALAGDAGGGNAILANAIFDNGGAGVVGINLSGGSENGDEVTANDLGDADAGPNNLQNHPVLTSATTDGTQIHLNGSLNSTINSYFRIEFFANTGADPSGHGEGQRLIGFFNVATDGTGDVNFATTTLSASVAAGEFISATATRSDASYSAFTDTSEFAQNVVAAAPNQAPSGSDGTVSASEDTVYTFALADFGYSDIDGNTFDRLTITTLPGQGTLRWNGNLVGAADFVVAGDIALGLLTWTPPADANGAGFASFTFQVHDDGGTALGGSNIDATPNTLTINVAAVNDVPVNSVPATLTFAEDTPTAITGLSITDPDAGTGLLRTELTVTGGTLAAASGSGVVVTGSGTSALVLTGTLADLNAYLAGASAPTFSGAANYAGAVTLNMVSADGNNAGTGGTLAAGSFDYRFHDGTPAGSEPNNIPTTGGVAGVASSFNSGALAIALTGSNTSFGVIYTGAIEITTAGTYSFSATADDAARVLVDGNPLVFAFFGSGSGSVALDVGRHTVEIRHAQDSGGTGLSVSYSGADTGNAVTSLLAAPGAGRLVSHTASTAITLTAVNDAPLNQLPGLQVTAVNTPLVLSVANGHAISVSDVDAGGAALQMTLAATNGTLTLATITGLTFSTGDGSADATLVFTGSAAAINAALDGMSFTPTGGYNGNATITVTTNDQGNTGSGGAMSDTDVLNVQVGAARFQQGVDGYAGTQDTWVGTSAPATDHGAATTVVADDNSASDAALLRFDALFGNGVGQVPLGSTISGATLSVYVTNADAADLIALHRMLGNWTEASTYNTLTGGVQADGAEAAPGIELTFDSGVTGWNNLSSAAITATVQAWADGAANNGWAFISNNADSWTFASSENATVNLRPYLSINFTPPQAPVIGTSGGAASYTENGSAVVVDSGLVLSDADSTQLTSATVRITGNHLRLHDVLVFADENGITGNFVAATGTLTLSGSASVGQYEAALRSVTYTNTSEAPSTLVRTLAFSASDAFVTGSSAIRSLNVAAVNDAPVLGFISGNANVAENAGALLLAPGSTVSDVDSANFDGGQVVVQFSANGQPEDRLAVRHQGNAPGQIGVAGSVVSYGGTAIGSASGGNGGSALVITLNANADAAAVQALTRNLTYENTSDNPSTAVRSLQGWVSDGDGGTSSIASGTITMVPANDAPVVTATPGSLSYNENSPATAIDPALTVADVDSGAIVGATVRISVAYAFGEDVLGFTNQLGITGSWDATSGTLTLSGSAGVADYQTALRSVTYRNTSEAPSILVRTVEFTVNDGAAASTAATRWVQVVSIDDTPTTDPANASGTEDAAAIAVTLTGSDVDGTVNRFRLIDLPANGTLYLDAGLTTPAATATDIAATAQALTLYFVPAANWNGSTSFQFVARDAVGMTDLTPATATITVSAVNDAPVLTASGTPANYTENAAAVTIDPGATVSDADAADFAGGTLTVSLVAGGSTDDQLAVRHQGNGAGQIGVSGPTLSFGGVVIGSASGGSAGAALVITFNANADAATVQALARQLTFASSGDAVSTTPRTVRMLLTDGDGGSSANADTPVQVNAVNDAPTISAPATASVAEDGTLVFTAGPNALVVQDADAAGSPLSLTLTASNGTVTLASTSGLTFTVGDGSGDTTLTVSGTQAALNAALDGLGFAPSANHAGPASLQIDLSDLGNQGSGGALTATHTVAITVTAVNDAPTGAPVVTGTATEGQVLAADTSAIADADGLGAFTFQWQRNGADVAGAAASTYVLGNADVGAAIRVRVSYVDGQGNAEQLTSASVGPVANVNDAPTGVPVIGGSAVEDQTLSADTTAIADADGLGPFTFQWQRDGVDVAGATASTYTLGDADVGAAMRVRVAYVDGQGNAEQLTSASAGPVVNVNDAPTGAPVIGGSAVEDQTLTADTSAIADADGLGAFTFQWQRDGVDVAGANLSTYTLGDADVGAAVRVRVTYVDGHSTAEQLTSASASPVANVNDAPTGAPVIAGSAVEDQTLAADTSAIADADGLGAFTFQWQRNGVDLAGANASTYMLGDADVGALITVRASWTDGHGHAEQLTSAAAGPVANVNDTPAGAPAVTGAATEGAVLAVDLASIADADGLGPFTFQWQRNGVDVAGANASTYTLGDADVGAAMRVRVAYADGHGSAEQLTSASTSPVANVNDAPAGVPVVTGTATEDQTLAVDLASIADADGLGPFTFQWQRNGVDVAGANASTYTLGDADVGASIGVRVAYADGHGTAEQLTSASTSPVANVNDAPTGAPVIAGSAVEDQTLTVDTSAIADADGLGAFTFQWQRNGVDLAGANASTYTLGDADVGALITVRASWTDGHGHAEQLTSAAAGPVANVNDTPAGAPAITGSATEGAVLAVDLSSIADADGLGAFTIEWQRNGVAIAGASAATYTPGDADVGATIRVRVGYVDGHGTSEQVVSASTAPIANVNDAPTGAPVVTGIPTEDQTLAVDLASIVDADGLGAFTFQWQRNGVDVAGANASIYTLGDADVGASIGVRVSYVDGHGTAEQLTSASTSPVANVNDAPTGAPVIGGSAVEDQTLTVDTTTIADADGLGPFTLQWQRNGADIAGANGVAYTLGDADVGASIGVRVGWVDGRGAPTQLASATVGPVANLDDTPSGAPVIIGSAVEDQTLTADLSSIADADGLRPFTLQWLRNGAAIAGASGGSYTLGDADVGALIGLRVDYLDGQGHAERLLSASAGPVVNLNDTPGGVPVVTGSAVEDQVLVADLAAVSDADGLGSFTYQWLRDGVAITGANGASHTLGDADVGTQIAVRIGWLDGQGTAEQLTSASLGPIANVDDAPLGLPAISGTASEYQTLSADIGAITDADGLGPFTYQWLRDGVVIAGASGASLTLGAADVGHAISVRVAYVDLQGTPTLLTSVPTAAVANVADAPVGLPALLGAATEGETLGADTGAISDADGLGPFTFQWQRDGVDVAGANTAAYTLTDADVGAQLALRLSYTDGHGALEELTSAPSTLVANVNDAPTGLPVSTGVAVSGQVLVADTRAIADADGLGPISFTWLRNGVAVAGAAAPSYLISDADQGQAISVRMSYLDGHGTLETLTSLPVTVGTSAETPPVVPPAAPPPAAPSAGPAPAGDAPAATAPADAPVDTIAPAPTAAPARPAEPQAPAPDLADIGTASSGAAELTAEVVRASAAGSTPRSDGTDYLALLAGLATDEQAPGEWSLQDLLLVDAEGGRSAFQSRPGGAVIDPNGAAGDDENEALSWTQIAGVSSLALTAGTVWWALRAGGLLTSLMVSMPAWRHADLLAVLPDDEDDDAWDLADDEQARRDEEAVGDLFDPTADGAPR